MAPIPEHIIDRIRESVNIVDLVSRYVSLRKRGRNFIGLCPFHQEKTPSFTVNPEKQIFHCFGCGQGGNAFRFLMQHEKLSFVDAVKRLSEETGIEIPVSEAVKQQISDKERLLKANEMAMRYFQSSLHSAPPEVTKYLSNRGVNAEMVKTFNIGYAPEGWDGLQKQVERSKIPASLFKTLGLLLESEKSKRPYDRFRHRLMFPIHNTSGKVVGFGGRAFTDDKKTPKYINSPESPVYQKSRILYGLFSARDAIRENEYVIFVEGYMDVIQLYQAGIRQVVATSGTALTESHASLIRRYANKVKMCYDADQAGVKAAMRGGEILFQHGVEVEVLILPAGEDPDSFVKKNGKDAFLEALKNAKDYMAFRLDLMRKKYDLQTANGRSAAVAEIGEVLSVMQDNVRMDFFVEKSAQALQIPQTLLMNQIRDRRKMAERRASFASEPEMPFPPDEAAAPKRSAPLVFSGAWGGEKDVLLLLIQFFADIYEYVFSHLSADDFLNAEFRKLFLMLSELPADTEKNILHLVLDNIENEELRALLLREMEHTNREFSKPALYLQGCIKQIKIAYYQQKFEMAQLRIKGMKPDHADFAKTINEMTAAKIEQKKWAAVVIREEE